jgi:uncharacterized alpha-E superfamily protein
MPREEGWYFLQAGRYLERAEKTARALDVHYRLLSAEDDSGREDDWQDRHDWITVLRSMSAYEAYYRVSSSAVRADRVVALLALSPVVPRSIRFAVARVDAALDHITDDATAYNGSEPTRTPASEARRAVGRLHAELEYQRIEDVMRTGLHAWLLGVQGRCWEIGEHVEREYFAHRPLTAEEVVA